MLDLNPKRLLQPVSGISLTGTRSTIPALKAHSSQFTEKMTKNPLDYQLATAGHELSVSILACPPEADKPQGWFGYYFRANT
jgi:hypothetical protein